jgi:hypothetical protein
MISLTNSGKNNNHMKQASHLTFVIADIIRHLATAQMKAEVLSREPEVKDRSRDTVNRIGIRCKVAINEVRHLLSPAAQKIVDDELLPAEVFLQIDQVVTAMYAMPKGVRDEIESYVMSRYNIYSLNKTA